MSRDYISAPAGGPEEGNLLTPINNSAFSAAFIHNLPAYRQGLSPVLRGLEVGLAHGYFLVGPWTKLGPLRDSDVASLGGLISAVALILIATIGLSAHGSVSFQRKSDGTDPLAAYSSPDRIKTSEGWGEFTAGFFVGGTGGAFIAFFLLQNFGVVDGIMRGLFN